MSKTRIKKTHFIPLQPEAIHLTGLSTAGKRLFGREKEITFLSEAWESNHTNVVTLAARRGEGKTAVVNRWLSQMERENFRGAKKVFGWTFYTRAVPDNNRVSADEFLHESLKWFGDADPTSGSIVEKGKRLAKLVRKQRTLLILNGLEPFQYSPGEVGGSAGKLKDLGLKTLVKELAISQPGLCVITSGEGLTDLPGKIDFKVSEIRLGPLPETAGLQLLADLELTGSPGDMVKAVKEYNGHALTLILLGRYLHDVYGGDIGKRVEIPVVSKNKKQGDGFLRIMEAYYHWLGDSPERDILHILCLFDGPAEECVIDALKACPALPGVTEQLQKLSGEDWQYALSRLIDSGLMDEKNPQKPDDLHCHPLIREYLSQKLQDQNPNGWEAAHHRLYRYYKDFPGKKLPETLQEMGPLFKAVTHGCRAGLYQEALIDVYWARIKRKNQNYNTRQLGAFGADIAALSYFFAIPWNQPADGFTDHEKVLVSKWSAFSLCAAGRLQEAIQPLQAALEIRVNQEKWKDAGMIANNLSELMLTLGQVNESVGYARQSVIFADRAEDCAGMKAFRTTLADSLHQFGQLGEAEKMFLEAETMQKKEQPEFPLLYSLWGFRLCNFLLGRGMFQEVIDRVNHTLKWEKQQGSLLGIHLGKLSLARAWMMQAREEEQGNDDYKGTADFLNQAAASLRKFGNQEFLVFSLLNRAAFYRWRKQYHKAWIDLKEVEEISELWGIKLYMVDYHLEAGRLCLEQENKKEARLHFKIAKKKIDQMGYHRKDTEVMAI